MIKLKRAYESPQPEDGFRVLVDRLWPRGISKKDAHIDLWFKDVAPSTELRKWFSHDPNKWEEFVKKYTQELKNKKDLLKELKDIEREHKTLTLVYGAKDENHNQAVVIGKIVNNY